ncbi:MAG: lactate utilization protein [Clostridia bacterium]|nr:lactate utilization protein [Clostridia bacterium]
MIERNRKAGESVVTALRMRHFDAHYRATMEEALALAESMIPADAEVTFGGSMTVQDSGLISRLAEKGCAVFDRGSVPAAERAKFVEEHFFADWFLGSVNAMSEDGVLYNMDGNGNRVASYIYGPKNVLLLVGMNKVVQNEQAAIARVRGLAAPTNAQRFDIDTPCRKTGRCADCKSPDCICATMTTMRLCRPAGRIHIILVGEDWGF